MNKKEKLQNYIDELFSKYYEGGFVDAEEMRRIVENLSEPIQINDPKNKIEPKEPKIIEAIFNRIISNDEFSQQSFSKFGEITHKIFSQHLSKLKSHPQINLMIQYFSVYLKTKMNVSNLKLSGGFNVAFLETNHNNTFEVIKPNDLNKETLSKFIAFLQTRSEQLDPLSNGISIIKNKDISNRKFYNAENLVTIVKNNDDFENIMDFSDENFNICHKHFSENLNKIKIIDIQEIIGKKLNFEYSIISFGNAFPESFLEISKTPKKQILLMMEFIDEVKEAASSQTSELIYTLASEEISRGQKPPMKSVISYDKNNYLKKQWQEKFGFQKEVAFVGEPIVFNTPAVEILNGNVTQVEEFELDVNIYKRIIQSEEQLHYLMFEGERKIVKAIFSFIWSKNKEDLNFFMLPDEYGYIQEDAFRNYLSENLKGHQIHSNNIGNPTRKEVASSIQEEIKATKHKIESLGIKLEELTLEEYKKELKISEEKIKREMPFIEKWLTPEEIKGGTIQEVEGYKIKAKQARKEILDKFNNKNTEVQKLEKEFNVLAKDLDSQNELPYLSEDEPQNYKFDFKPIEKLRVELKEEIQHMRLKRRRLLHEIKRKRIHVSEISNVWKSEIKSNQINYDKPLFSVLKELERNLLILEEQIEGKWESIGYKGKIKKSEIYNFAKFQKNRRNFEITKLHHVTEIEIPPADD